MVTLTAIVVFIGVLFIGLVTGAAVLLDPLIAVLAIYGIYRLIKMIRGKRS